MNGPSDRRYQAWRKRQRARWRVAAEQPVAARVPEVVDVGAIRSKLGLTQQQFAHRFGFSVGAVRDWENDRHQPDTALRAFLLVIANDPDAVDRALRAAAEQAAHTAVEARVAELVGVLTG